MGRNIENEILAQVKKRLIEKEIKTVSSTYIKTAKNAPVETLFEKMGFSITEQDDKHKEYIITKATETSEGTICGKVFDISTNFDVKEIGKILLSVSNYFAKFTVNIGRILSALGNDIVILLNNFRKVIVTMVNIIFLVSNSIVKDILKI